MSVDFLSKNFPPFQVHHAKKPPRFYPDGFQRNVIDFYFIFSDCRLRKALYLQFSYFIWPLGNSGETIQNDFYDEISEKSEKAREETRILYVAMTRSIRSFSWVEIQGKQNLSWQNLIETEV